MTSERELIEKSRNGDAESFERLVRRYEGRIYRLARHVCSGLPSDADDVYQETFLTAFKKLKGFRADADLGTWLYRIASNLCFMRYRRKKREPFVPLLDRPHDHDRDGAPRGPQYRDLEPTPEEAARRQELASAVSAALARLPVDYRLVVVLRDVEGLSAEETARVLELGVAAVKSRLHRGRLFLRDEFRRSFDANPPRRSGISKP
jgi:RNA polymerase sigma-70 factor, ECF subfamily